MRSKVIIALANARYVTVRPNVLTPDTYALFQAAVNDSTYFVRDLRTKAAPLDRVSLLIQRLRKAGGQTPCFDVHIEPSVLEAMTPATGDDWVNLHATRDRILKIDEEIFRRTSKRLFPYQHIGAEWLTLRKDGLLADGMGLGKTLQAIAAIPAGAPVLVVCPSAAKYSWESELDKWRPHIPKRVMSGRKSFRWPEPGEIAIINYDILPDIHDREKCDGFLPAVPCPGCKEELDVSGPAIRVTKTAHKTTCKGFMKRLPCPGCGPVLHEVHPGTVVVGDEAQRLKDRNSNRSRAFFALGQAVRDKDGRRWLLTGTPLENNPLELWTVLQAAGLAEQAFGGWAEFKEIFKATRKTHGFGGYDFGIPDEKDMRERLRRVSLRRVKSEVLSELPPKLYQTLKVDLKKETLRQVDVFLKKAGGLARVIELLSLPKIPFDQISQVRALLAAAKIPAMLEYVEMKEEEEDPFLVFSAHRAPIDLLAARPGWNVITGETKDKDRRPIVEAFQAGKLKGLGIMIRAGGTAITLTRAATSLFVDRDWNPKASEQAEDRIHRIGQTRGVMIVDLIAKHPLDERVWELIHEKEKMFDATVNASRVGPNVAVDRERQAALEAIQAELKDHSGTRCMAGSEEEKTTLERLFTAVFESPIEEKLAGQLAEEAETIGLTNAQWILARNVAMKGASRSESIEVTANEVVRVPDSLYGSATTPEEDDMGRKSERETATGEEGTRQAPSSAHVRGTAGFGAEPHDGDDDSLCTAREALQVEAALSLAESFGRCQRVELLATLMNTLCIDCGGVLPDSDDEEHNCPLDPRNGLSDEEAAKYLREHNFDE